MSMLTTELEAAIRQALDDATRRGHEFSGLEHLLLALLQDEKTADVVKQWGGSAPRAAAPAQGREDGRRRQAMRRLGGAALRQAGDLPRDRDQTAAGRG